MTLEVIPFVLGAMGNNSYLIADPGTREAIVIDPSFGSEAVLREAARRKWTIRGIWLTHAHFDHIAGINALLPQVLKELPVEHSLPPTPLPIGIHNLDLPLYHQQGGAALFQLQIDPCPEPILFFEDKQTLYLGNEQVEVLHTPGHTPGHVVFYSPESGTAFTGDLIFYRGVGRTDLPGGDMSTLLRSIRQRIFTLPPDTRLLSGHGPETSVKEEKEENPFL